MHQVLLSLACLALLSSATVGATKPSNGTAAAVAGAAPKGVALLQTHASEDPDKIPEIIHTIPRLIPNGHYTNHLKKIFQHATEEARKDDVEHIEKLERQNYKLRRKVAALSEALGDSESDRVLEAQEIKEEKKERAALEDKNRQSAAISSQAAATEIKTSAVQLTGETSETLLFFGTILMAQVFLMAQSQDVTVRCMTWSLLENVIAMLVAVMWFQATDDFFQWCAWSHTWVAIGAIAHALAINVIFIFVAWRLRHKEDLLWTVTACGAHYVGFTAVHAGSQVQDSFFSWHYAMCFLSLFVLFFLCAGFSFVTHKVLSLAEHRREVAEAAQGSDQPTDPAVLDAQYGDPNFPKFIEKIEELEDDVCGMLLAFAWTMLVRYLISGTYQTFEEGETGQIQHNWVQRLILFIYLCCMLGLTFYLLPKLQQLSQKLISPLKKRVLLMLHPFLTMSVAWAVLLWADWTFYEAYFRGKAVLGRMWFAFLASFVVFGIIYFIAHTQKRIMHPDRNSASKDDREKAHAVDLAMRWTDLERRKFTLCMMALVVAFAWEETYDESIEGSYSMTGSGWKTLIKFFDAMIISAVLLPVYVWYVRPHVEGLEEEEDKLLELHLDHHTDDPAIGRPHNLGLPQA